MREVPRFRGQRGVRGGAAGGVPPTRGWAGRSVPSGGRRRGVAGGVREPVVLGAPGRARRFARAARARRAVGSQRPSLRRWARARGATAPPPSLPPPHVPQASRRDRAGRVRERETGREGDSVPTASLPPHTHTRTRTPPAASRSFFPSRKSFQAGPGAIPRSRGGAAALRVRAGGGRVGTNTFPPPVLLLLLFLPPRKGRWPGRWEKLPAPFCEGRDGKARAGRGGGTGTGTRRQLDGSPREGGGRKVPVAAGTPASVGGGMRGRWGRAGVGRSRSSSRQR